MPADCSQRGGTLAAANTIVLRTRQTRAVVLVTIIRNIFSLPAPHQSKILICINTSGLPGFRCTHSLFIFLNSTATFEIFEMKAEDNSSDKKGALFDSYRMSIYDVKCILTLLFSGARRRSGSGGGGGGGSGGGGGGGAVL